MKSKILVLALCLCLSSIIIPTGKSIIQIDIDLVEDYWNFKSYTNMTDTYPGELMNLIPNCTAIIGKNDTSNYWYTYWPSLGLSENWTIKQGDGLFIRTSTSETWSTVFGDEGEGYTRGDLFVDGNLSVSGNSSMDYNLTVNGSMTIEGNFEVNTLTVTGNITGEGNLTVSEDLNVGDSLVVNGDIQAQTMTVSDNLTVTGNISIGNDMVVGNDLVVNGNLEVLNDLTVGNLSITQDLSVGGNLSVTNNAVIEGDLEVYGSSTISGDLVVSGQILGITGRGASIVIASSTTNEIGKAQADYVCDGVNDELEFHYAIENLSSGGKILVLNGTFVFNSYVSLVSGITIEGMGYQATKIERNGSVNERALSSSVSSGENVVELASSGDANSFNIGQGVLVADSDSRQVYQATYTYITDIVDRNITTAHNFKDDYTTGNNAFIQSGTPFIVCDSLNHQSEVLYQNPVVKGIRFDGKGDTSDSNVHGLALICYLNIRGGLVQECYFEGHKNYGIGVAGNDTATKYMMGSIIEKCVFNSFSGSQGAVHLDYGVAQCIVRDNHFIGNEDNGVYVCYTYYENIITNNIFNTTNIGVSVNLDGGRSTTVSGNSFAGIKTNGILGSDCQASLITGNHFILTAGTGFLISITTGAQGTVISDNVFLQCNSQDGINIGASDGVMVIDNQFDNYYDDVGYGIGKAIVHGGSHGIIRGNHISGGDDIAITVTGNGTSITDNYIEGQYSGTPVSYSGTNATFHNNFGFVTENSGTAGPGTSIEVTHGLAGTPTTVIICPLATTNDFYISARTSTTFTITSQASISFDWYAIYKP